MSEEQVKHLEMIQSIVNRLSSNSFSYKAWVVGIVSALFAVGVSAQNIVIFALSIIPIGVFWFLDSYYLYQERLFRGLYDRIRSMTEAEWRQDPFSMDYRLSASKAGTYRSVLFSRTILPLYGSLMLVVILVLAILFVVVVCNWCG